VTTIVEIDPGRPGEGTDPRRTAVADRPNEVDHRLARHAIEDIPPSDALLLAIEALIEVSQLIADGLR